MKRKILEDNKPITKITEEYKIVSSFPQAKISPWLSNNSASINRNRVIPHALEAMPQAWYELICNDFQSPIK